MLIVRFLLLVTLFSIAFAELRLQNPASNVRVRKEWRQLSSSDRKKVDNNVFTRKVGNYSVDFAFGT